MPYFFFCIRFRPFGHFTYIFFLKGWIILNGIFFWFCRKFPCNLHFSAFFQHLHFRACAICILSPLPFLWFVVLRASRGFQWGLGHTAFRGFPRMPPAGGRAVAGGAGVAEAFRIHPERSQKHPKITQTGPKMTPKTQNGPKVSEITQTDPKMAPKVPKMVRKVPKMVRKVPKMVRCSSQNGQKMTQNGPKMSRKISKCPKCQMLPKMGPNNPKVPKMTPNQFLNGPKSAQNDPKMVGKGAQSDRPN